MKIIGKNGQSTIKNNGRKLTDLCVQQQRIRNSFCKHKDTHKFTWCPHGRKSRIDYVITNQKSAKLIKDVRVYTGAELNTYHFNSVQNYSSLQDRKTAKIIINLTEETIIYFR
jgi:hypothetical protein